MGFFQSLKQDLSEAVGELIGEEDALEGVENGEEAGDAAEASAEADEMPEDAVGDTAVEYGEEGLSEGQFEENEGLADFSEANTAEELNALLKDVIQPADEAELPDELPAEDTAAENQAGNVDTEAAAMALFDSLSDEEGLSFADDNNEVDLAEKLAEEAYKAELLAEEDGIQKTDDADMDADEAVSAEETIASLDDIDINKMLENIQGELNAVQEESFQDDGPADDAADIVAESELAIENVSEEAAEEAASVEAADAEELLDSIEISPEPQAEDDMIDGQMSLEEMMAMAESLTNESFADEEPAADSDKPELESAAVETSVVETSAVEESAVDKAINDVAAQQPDDFTVSVATDTAPDTSEESDAEPAKEKKAKKTSRKKKGKADVSAAIGAEELAGRVFSDETAHLSDGMMIRGNIISDGNMEVAGEIDGNIDILGKLNVSGTINGNTKAGELYAEGAEINGNIECSGSVKVGQGAVIIGDVAGTSAVIAGAVKGNIDVHGPVILADSAIVMGDIRSASVQISNGAAVEGMCSQIYAEVSPKNFFKDLKKAK